MQRKLRVFLALLLAGLLPFTALAAGNVRTKWTNLPEMLRPGKSVRLTFYCPVVTTATITLVDSQEQVIHTLWEEQPTVVGENAVLWDGRAQGADVAPGTYTLRIALSGKIAEGEILLGDPAPQVLGVHGDQNPDGSWEISAEITLGGEVTLMYGETVLARQQAAAGEVHFTWDGLVDGQALGAGEHEVAVRVTDATGFVSSPALFSFTVDAPPQPALMGDATALLPSDVSCDHGVCYWKMARGETDVNQIWQVLTQGITVLAGDERKQARVYESPDTTSRAIAEVTYESQAVHVLEKGEDWSRIEGYSSSVEGSSVANYAGHFVGYVQTSLLKEREVNQHIGMVIDKLQQRLYVYQDGELLSTLLCSTGFPSESAPWNETPAGEYVIISRTGGFWSGSLYCDMGLRINDGILLHEVPCQINEEDQSRDYSRCERYLGEKASHGCIRIQRRLTPEGVNMEWLWDNAKVGVKVLIWDEIGRELTYPDSDVVLYYNTENGKQYHASATCRAVREVYWPLTPFTYGELENAPYATLTPCPACAPQPRMDAIDEMNEKNDRVEVTP